MIISCNLVKYTSVAEMSLSVRNGITVTVECSIMVPASNNDLLGLNVTAIEQKLIGCKSASFRLRR